MGIVENLLLAVGLAMDAFAVSLCVGATGRVPSKAWYAVPPLYFGLFQALMPIIGWFGGAWLVHLIGPWDHWLAFGLLAFVGGRMLKSGLSKEENPVCVLLTHREALVLAVATSIDALAVGLSLAMLQVSIWQPAAIIGMVTALLSGAAILLGRKVGMCFGRRAELVGGIVLLAIGLRVLISHLVKQI